MTKKDKDKEVPLYEMRLDAHDDGVYAVSLVDYPAIQTDFQYFNEDSLMKFKEQSKEEQTVLGPVMIPDQKIQRYEDGEPYFVFYRAETVKKAAHRFLKKGLTSEVTEMHLKEAANAYIIESWLVKDPEKDKSSCYGYTLPKGTWCMSIKIEDKDYFDEAVKSGKVRGFSIEGLFTRAQVMQFNSKQNHKYESIDFTPPETVRENAKQALDYIDRGCEAGTRVGLARANQLANNDNLSPDTINRMVSFFARHEDNRGDGTEVDSNNCPTAGYIAWLLWGGDAGRTWAEEVQRQMETEDNQTKETNSKSTKTKIMNNLEKILNELGFEKKESVHQSTDSAGKSEKDKRDDKEDKETKQEAGEGEVELALPEDQFLIVPEEGTEMEVMATGSDVVYSVTVAPVAEVEVEDPSDDPEQNVDNPNEAVADREALKQTVARLEKEIKTLKTKRSTPVKFSKTEEGKENKPADGVTEEAAINYLRNRKK